MSDDEIEVRRLLGQLYVPEIGEQWLTEHHPVWAWRPIDLINEGHGDVVITHLKALLEGAYL